MSISQRQLFLKHVAQTSPSPMALEIDHGIGCELVDVNGKKYIDLISGISVSSIGHCHPKVVDAIALQSKKYMHTMVYGEYIQGPQVKLAKALIELLPKNLDSVYFVNSGAEAIEGALKLSKRVTGRTEIISFNNAYHGSTHGALSIMGSEFFKNSFRPLLPDTRLIEYNNEQDLNFISSKTACVVAEVIQAEAGVIVPKNNYLKKLKERCDEVGALLIFDEIQTGFGRTGSFFAFEQFEVIPDILAIAKAMGGGLPIGAFISSKQNMDSFTEQPILGHITTFGGNPVSCAASLATLKEISENKLFLNAKKIEAIIRKELIHPAIQEIRAFGALIAVELGSNELNMKVISKAIELGVITDWFLFCDTSLRIAPPLIIAEDELIFCCKAIKSAIEQSL